jgi:hypothetical protein
MTATLGQLKAERAVTSRGLLDAVLYIDDDMIKLGHHTCSANGMGAATGWRLLTKVREARFAGSYAGGKE